MKPIELARIALQSAKPEVDAILADLAVAASQGTFSISRPEITEATRERLDYKGFVTSYSNDRNAWAIDFGDCDDLNELHKAMDLEEAKANP
jgi:hypothetical protein